MKLSIITINRNNAKGLQKTLASVKAQTSTDFEHIIIDGASTDDSVNVIRLTQMSVLIMYVGFRNQIVESTMP